MGDGKASGVDPAKIVTTTQGRGTKGRGKKDWEGNTIESLNSKSGTGVYKQEVPEVQCLKVSCNVSF